MSASQVEQRASAPATMADLPRDRRGLPVPWVAAWSSETWSIGHDPLVDHPVAMLSRGRQGRGKPCFDVMNEPRQRRAVVLRLCQVCATPLDGTGWLPNSSADAHLADGTPVSTEPPCCEPCARWVVGICPGVRKATALLEVIAYRPIAQLVDPSRAPAGHYRRFGPDDPALRERLGRVARRHGGAVGYLKLALDEIVEHPIEVSRG